ncbi:hypothetical protein LTR36_007113 [Oleoguttula mirabilis]|uniref:Methyltransferase type 11 domain-containing protein n=1 Tax=Oleoguttula mirabilis TaxID=1507867 RepID=A0AAV9JAC3_9PEZI|nr:hypothetical protein LTR36_007113 [Oleoguttula mirabilis]
MAAEDHHSDLEVVSKEMSNGLDDIVDSKVASPNDSPKLKQNGHAPTFSENGVGMKLDTSMANGHSNGSIDAVLDGVSKKVNGINMGGISPEDYSADPMVASALMSPLHDRLNLDAMFSITKPSLHRAPSILKNTSAISDEWELYKRAGPKYPASLEQLFMKYHEKHSNSWQLAHDLGAGSGVYSPTLARFFRHIHVSDPTTSGIATSRQLLSAWSTQNPKSRGRFTFSVNKPEEAAECATDSSVDFAVITESAHFATDIEATVRSVAQTLTTGGTLAIITHRPISNVVGNEKVKEAVRSMFDAWGRKPWDVACGDSTKSRQQFSLGLDFVPLPEELFKREETRRITINTHGRARELFHVPDNEEEEDTPMSPAEMWDMASSRVDEKEKRHEFADEHESGKGWRHEVGWESFRTRIAMFDSPDAMQRLEPHLTEIQDLIMKTSPNGVKVVIEWAVSVVLATKK